MPDTSARLTAILEALETIYFDIDNLASRKTTVLEATSDGAERARLSQVLGTLSETRSHVKQAAQVLTSYLR